MTLLSDVIRTCRNDYLLTGGREPRNRLTNTVDATQAGWTLDFDLQGIASGAKLYVDLEDVSVWDANTTTKTVTVERGDFSTVAASHTAGTPVTVSLHNCTNAQIVRAVNHELGALSSPKNGLFRMRSVDVTYDSNLQGYDLTGTTNVISVWQVRYKATGVERDWPVIGPNLWTFQRESDTTVFPSGNVLFLREEAQPGLPIRVWYRTGFTSVTNMTDDIQVVSGLHAEAHDILSIGAAWRLTAGREVTRNFMESQGDPRRAGEVPPGAALGASRFLQAVRQDRIKEEASRLGNLYRVRI